MDKRVVTTWTLKQMIKIKHGRKKSTYEKCRDRGRIKFIFASHIQFYYEGEIIKRMQNPHRLLELTYNEILCGMQRNVECEIGMTKILSQKNVNTDRVERNESIFNRYKISNIFITNINLYRILYASMSYLFHCLIIKKAYDEGL